MILSIWRFCRKNIFCLDILIQSVLLTHGIDVFMKNSPYCDNRQAQSSFNLTFHPNDCLGMASLYLIKIIVHDTHRLIENKIFNWVFVILFLHGGMVYHFFTIFSIIILISYGRTMNWFMLLKKQVLLTLPPNRIFLICLLLFWKFRHLVHNRFRSSFKSIMRQIWRMFWAQL